MKTLPALLVLATLIFCSAMMGVNSLFAQNEDAELKELKSLRFEFQVTLAELEKPLAEFNRKYRGYLEKQKAAYQEQGKLKAMLAVDGELKTFENELAEEFSTFPELKRLQQIFREQRATKEKAVAEPRLKLITEYRKVAGDLATKWTKEGKIEAAKVALAEAERLEAMEKDAGLAKKSGQTLASGPALRTVGNFAGRTAGEEMKNGLGMKLCWIPAGKFTMGSPKDEPEREADKEAQVEVELTSGFWMGKYEVTQEEYEDVIGSNPAIYKDVGKDAPVEQVNWEEAVAFCGKLTERERKRDKLPEGWAYVLPTEAQWEYACRAGEKGPYSGGELDEVGWHIDNGGGKTHEVGEKKANAWGLHDVHGNVREWCLDWFADKLSGGTDPTGPTGGSGRVHRGGDWKYRTLGCRAAHRYGYAQTTRGSFLGLRVCLSSTSK